jgi:phytoene dehydrogenase-like protein
VEHLRAEGKGFTANMLERFFRPFFSGVFLEKDLASSSCMFEFVFRMLAQGDTALPADGMGAIPRQIAASLPPEAIRLNAGVDQVGDEGVRLDSGEEIIGKPMVLATDGKEAARLRGIDKEFATVDCGCLYFSANNPPVSEPILVLDGEGQGPVTNLGVLSQVAPSYAPA